MANTTRENVRAQSSQQSRPAIVVSGESTGDNQYQALFAQLQSRGFCLGGAKRTVGIVSAAQNEGVTTVACDLAFHAASCHGLHVLLIDANHTKPDIHCRFHLQRSPGLAELLNGEAVEEDSITDMSSRSWDSWPQAYRQSQTRGRGLLRFLNRKQESFEAPQLSVMPSGDSVQTPRHLRDPNDEWVPNRASSEFDLVVIDLPPASSAIGCGFSLADIDGVLFVLAAETTTDIAARKSISQLRQQGANVLGIAFNKCRHHLPKWIDNKLGD